MRDTGYDPGFQDRERRVFIRFPRRLEMLWQLLGVVERAMTNAQLQDISATGVGLVCDQAFDEGTRLIIRLPTATQGWASHLVQVRHCKPVEPGVFQIGCRFLPALKREQLAELLI